LNVVIVVPMADGGEVISYRSVIPVELDGVLEHLLVGIEFRALLEFGIWKIVHSLDSHMPIFLK